MDSVDIQNFEEDIEEILTSSERSKNGTGSEDTVDDLIRDLGERLGHHVYLCDGFNDYVLDREALQELEDVGLGEVDMKFGFPRLIIGDPDNPENTLEVSIIDPTEQL